MQTPWPAFGWGRTRGKSLWKRLLPHFWMQSPPLSSRPTSHPSLAQSRGLGRKNLFPFLSFPIQSPSYNLSQGEKGWEGAPSPPEPEEEDTLGQRGETLGLYSHDCCSLKSASQSAERSAWMSAFSGDQHPSKSSLCHTCKTRAVCHHSSMPFTWLPAYPVQIVSKITPGWASGQTAWHSLCMKCCRRNFLCIWWQQIIKRSYRNDIWPGRPTQEPSGISNWPTRKPSTSGFLSLKIKIKKGKHTNLQESAWALTFQQVHAQGSASGNPPWSSCRT